MGRWGGSSVFRLVSGLLSEHERAPSGEEIVSCRHCAALVAERIRGTTIGNIEPSIEVARHDGALARYIQGPVITRGGMGIIVAAFDRQLDRTVVGKSLDRSTPLLMARFEHPGIIDAHLGRRGSRSAPSGSGR